MLHDITPIVWVNPRTKFGKAVSKAIPCNYCLTISPEGELSASPRSTLPDDVKELLYQKEG